MYVRTYIRKTELFGLSSKWKTKALWAFYSSPSCRKRPHTSINGFNILSLVFSQRAVIGVSQQIITLNSPVWLQIHRTLLDLCCECSDPSLVPHSLKLPYFATVFSCIHVFCTVRTEVQQKLKCFFWRLWLKLCETTRTVSKLLEKHTSYLQKQMKICLWGWGCVQPFCNR